MRQQQSEERVKSISEQLANALADITTKDNLVKQHVKVAEDAVSGIYDNFTNPSAALAINCFRESCLNACVANHVLLCIQGGRKQKQKQWL
jgi:selenophosphate synthase